MSPDNRTIYVEAEDDGYVKLFGFSATGGGAPQTLYTPTAGRLYGVRAEAGVIVARHSGSTDPGQIVRFDASTKREVPLTTINAARLSQLHLPAPEHFWFTAKNGKRIHSLIVPPPVVDPGRSTRSSCFPHGGPNSMSADAFSTRWNYSPAHRARLLPAS